MAFAETTPDTSAAFAATVLRRSAINALNTLYNNMVVVVSHAQVHGKAALAAELDSKTAGDAADFAAFYDSSRALLIAHSQIATVATDIPLRANLPA